MDEFIILIPEDDRAAFEAAWGEAAACAKVKAPALPEPGRIERFDAGTLLEYGLEFLKALPAILLALQPFLMSRRGKVIIGDTTLEMENLTVQEMERILRARAEESAGKK